MKTKEGFAYGVQEIAHVESVSTIDGLMSTTVRVHRELARLRQMLIERRAIDA